MAIEEFGRLLVEWVRDRAIKNCDKRFRAEARYSSALAWKNMARDEAVHKAMLTIIPDVVDETLFCLLSAIDQEVLRLSFVSQKGESEDLIKSGMGELAGWYLTDEGWAARYSQERLTPDL